jgi:hypothetical protein
MEQNSLDAAAACRLNKRKINTKYKYSLMEQNSAPSIFLPTEKYYTVIGHTVIKYRTLEI